MNYNLLSRCKLEIGCILERKRLPICRRGLLPLDVAFSVLSEVDMDSQTDHSIRGRDRKTYD
jgi:hypothetical protein